ncbi:hypothetical protein LX32DRAFT_307241 [Colletotrichum zoysiae]|uniref:Uncharacterized protein n=1 Tax=Colletotrichum zoysiae TaxID=1216348 RepID=A0AAD9HUW3_9PEZI|nr:hypothetical protein LX32DRAFT_307241 [Colletotrichum zoysiae]
MSGRQNSGAVGLPAVFFSPCIVIPQLDTQSLPVGECESLQSMRLRVIDGRSQSTPVANGRNLACLPWQSVGCSFPFLRFLSRACQLNYCVRYEVCIPQAMAHWTGCTCLFVVYLSSHHSAPSLHPNVCSLSFPLMRHRIQRSRAFQPGVMETREEIPLV